MFGKLTFILFIFLLFSNLASFAQEDSLNIDFIPFQKVELNTSQKQENNTSQPNSYNNTNLADATVENDSLNLNKSEKRLFNFKNPHNRPLLLSAILPGAGQIHNKQLVKAPFYPSGIVLGLSSALKFQSDFKNLGKSIEIATTVDERATLRTRQNRNRNLANASYAFSVFSYTSGIADAFISSKLKANKTERHSAAKAAYRSAMLPGLGQIYNKQTWKTSLIYAALIGSSVAVIYNLKEKNCHKNLYLSRVRYAHTDSTLMFKCLTENEITNFESVTNDALLDGKQYFDKNLQWSIVALSGVYLLNIIDSYVYAHLYYFKEIEEDLEVKITPNINYTIDNQISMGFSLKIRL